ncbi:hypothetical protein BZK31_03280 [Pseudomonas floridensis]|uniref:Uncharacterized protein n=1 Tax=Pseudomonas floridensis TaxID=1958950 RepID=A0A1X0NB41_9PSED|nr:hypothetical protein [Pseudomonas floridensis]ORC61344.1 hypothetical protein BZK31_03280 [Pseudomonas floridensis]
MSKLKLDANTLALLKAQVRLTETFNHTIRSLRGDSVPFRLNVERTSDETRFIVAMGGQRDSLTLPNTKAMHLKLAAFIEEIANGQAISNLQSSLEALRRPGTGPNNLDEQTSQKIFNLVRRGGSHILDVGLELPIHVAMHRNRTRSAVTTVMSIGVKRPRTKCFTVAGTDAEIYKQIIESINHLISVASPAAHAA